MDHSPTQEPWLPENTNYANMTRKQKQLLNHL